MTEKNSLPAAEKDGGSLKSPDNEQPHNPVNSKHTPDVIYRYALHPEPGFQYVSPAVTAISGYTPEEHYADPELGLKLVHPEDRPLLDSIRKSPETIQNSVVLRWIRKDGKVIRTDHRIVPIRGAKGRVTAIVGIARDITHQGNFDEEPSGDRKNWSGKYLERSADLVEVNEALQALIAEYKRAERETRLLLTITQAISAAKDFDSALRMTMEIVCQATTWDYGEAWIPDTSGSALRLSPSWHGNGKSIEKFRRQSEGFRFAPGDGMPGRVWRTKKPEWLENISRLPDREFPRVRMAQEAGLKAALAVPIIADDRVLAVLAFSMLRSRQFDRRMVEIVSVVADHLGSVLQHKQTEESLLKNETLLRAIVDNSTRVIYLKDRDGRYLMINRQYEKLFHVSQNEILNKTDHEIFGKENADQYRRNDLKVLQTGAPMEFEEVALHDNEMHTYISNKFPMFDSGGAIYAICGISSDITEHKRQEQALRSAHDTSELRVRERTAELAQANEALRLAASERERILETLQREKDFSESLINTAQVIVLLLDSDGKIFHFNPYFEEITGYSLAEVKGKDWFTTFLPERNREQIRHLFKTALQGVRTRGRVNPIVAKDGREREIEWFDKTLEDANGRTIGLLCIGQDITERRKAENWLHGLVQTTQDALVSIDRRGRIMLFNPAAERIFGYSKEEIVGQKVNVLMAEPYASEHDEYIAHYETTREARAIGRIRTVRAKRKNGETFPIELSVTEIATDQEIRYAAFIRDISEKTGLQEQLVESERLAAIGSTAAKIGHELANPLNGMYLAVQLLEQRFSRQPQALDNSVISPVKQIRTEIARLIQLLHDFRSLSRRERYNLQPIALVDLATNVMEIELPRCTAQGIEVELHIPEDMPLIVVDSDKMKQALLNLCKNAAEAMPGGGKITFTASATEAAVILEIADCGAGVTPGIDIFEPFSTTKSQGTGLGLVIVRQIVTAHGGAITYRSHPGKGTTFRITLPQGRDVAYG